jgi:hypothetical protein
MSRAVSEEVCVSGVDKIFDFLNTQENTIIGIALISRTPLLLFLPCKEGPVTTLLMTPFTLFTPFPLVMMPSLLKPSTMTTTIGQNVDSGTTSRVTLCDDSPEHAKPLFLCEESRDIHHIFFDDHISNDHRELHQSNSINFRT